MRHKRKNKNEIRETFLTVRLTKEQNRFLLRCTGFDSQKRGDVVRMFIDTYIQKQGEPDSFRGTSVRDVISGSVKTLQEINETLDNILETVKLNSLAYAKELKKLRQISRKRNAV